MNGFLGYSVAEWLAAFAGGVIFFALMMLTNGVAFWVIGALVLILVLFNAVAGLIAALINIIKYH